MSATKQFLYELQEYVWLVEFAPLTFQQRGKAIELMRDFAENKLGHSDCVHFAEWFDIAYELTEENGGADWATGKEAERLLSWVA